MTFRWASWSVSVVTLAVAGTACDASGGSAADPAGADATGRVVAGLAYATALTGDASDRALDVYEPSSGRGHPVALLLHGGGASKDTDEVVGLAAQLADNGVVVFVADHAARGAPDGVIADDGRRLFEGIQDTVCATRFMADHAADHGGDPERASIIGHSAGGLIGGLVAIGGETTEQSWVEYADRRGLVPQVACESEADLPPTDLIGFNAATFVFLRSGLPESDPELWSVADARAFTPTEGSVYRFLIGADDRGTPDWHQDEVRKFADELREGGHDAAAVTLEGIGHDWSLDRSENDRIISAIIEVAAAE